MEKDLPTSLVVPSHQWIYYGNTERLLVREKRTEYEESGTYVVGTNGGLFHCFLLIFSGASFLLFLHDSKKNSQARGDLGGVGGRGGRCTRVIFDCTATSWTQPQNPEEDDDDVNE